MVVKSWVVSLQIFRHAIPERASLYVIEKAMLKRVVENDIFFFFIIDL